MLIHFAAQLYLESISKINGKVYISFSSLFSTHQISFNSAQSLRHDCVTKIHHSFIRTITFMILVCITFKVVNLILVLSLELEYY